MLDFVLTDAERDFAAKHHPLIYAFLNREGLPEDEFYGVAALGYLEAVHHYLCDPWEKQCAFSTLACKSMRAHIADEQRTRSRQKRYAELVSLETGGAGGSPLYQRLPFREDVLFRELEERLLLHALVERLAPDQYAFVRLRMAGFSVREIAVHRGISEKRARSLMRQIRSIFWEVI